MTNFSVATWMSGVDLTRQHCHKITLHYRIILCGFEVKGGEAFQNVVDMVHLNLPNLERIGGLRGKEKQFYA
jgi:hypothetical protein